MDLELLPGTLISLILSVFFSGMELAFLSANKLQVELEEKQGITSGKIMAYFTQRSSWFIGTTLIGNTLAMVFFGILMVQLLAPLAIHLPAMLNNRVTVILLLCVISALLLITSELLSKSFFILNPNRSLSLLAVPFALFFILLFPLVFALVSVSKFIIAHVLHLPFTDKMPAFGLTRLSTYLQNRHHVKQSDEDIELDKRIFNNALEFKSVRIRECMIPRTEIVAVALEDGIEKLRDAFVESGHSKILVYRNTIDDVIGYCHSSALFKKPLKIEDILTPIITVPETTLANELMVEFINGQKSLAVVVDEFGGTSGIVSMEDVIEEIFGEIEDEHDEDDLIEQKLDNQTYLLSARLEIDYLNDTYHWNLPVGDYETLGGLILSYTEDFPQPNESISIPPFNFTIQSTEDNRIGTVKMVVANHNNPE